MLIPSVDILIAPHDRISASEYNRRGQVLQSVSRSSVYNGIADASGLHQRRSLHKTVIGIRLAKITEIATDNDHITCNLLDAVGTEIEDNIEVYCSISGSSALNRSEPYLANDQIIPVAFIAGFWRCTDVFHHKVTRMAKTTESATANNHITCNLLDAAGAEITSGDESGIQVYCSISNATALNVSAPRLEDDQVFPVSYLCGAWWCTGIFNRSDDCICTPPE